MIFTLCGKAKSGRPCASNQSASLGIRTCHQFTTGYPARIRDNDHGIGF